MIISYKNVFILNIDGEYNYMTLTVSHTSLRQSKVTQNFYCCFFDCLKSNTFHAEITKAIHFFAVYEMFT